MKVRVEDAGPCRKIVHVEVPAEAVSADYQEILKAFVGSARVPGFRPGRAPEAVVERHFAKSILEEARDRLVPQFYWKAVTEEKLAPVAVLDMADVTFEKEKGLAFKATIDVAPDFKLPKYKRLSIQGREPRIEDKDVDTALEKLRENLARFEDVTREVRVGDLVRIDFVGLCDGQPISVLAPDSGLGEGKDFWVLVGDPEFLPGLNGHLTGAAIDVAKDVAIRFPPDYRVPALASREATYRVTLKGIRERILPALDAEFFKTVGVDSLEALRGRLKERLVQGANENEKYRRKEEIIKALLGEANFDLPRSMVDQETAVTARGIVRDLMMHGGTKKDIEDHRKDILERATRSSTDRVRLSFVLQRIADEEKIEVTEAEMDAHLEILARQYNVTVDRLKADLEKKEAMDELKRERRAEKTLDFILENTKIKT